jgi:hypothetical protein
LARAILSDGYKKSKVEEDGDRKAA